MRPNPSGLGVALVDAEPRLVVTRASCVLRRDLGPVAWSVLEVLVLEARVGTDGRLVAQLGARQLAKAVGVGKDTAARGLLLLRRREMVSIEEQRAGNGRFCGGRYAINLAVSLKTDTVQASRRAKQAMPAPTLFDAPSGDLPRTAPPTPTQSHNVNSALSTILDHTDNRPFGKAATLFSKSQHEFALGMPDGPAGARC